MAFTKSKSKKSKVKVKIITGGSVIKGKFRLKKIQLAILVVVFAIGGFFIYQSQAATQSISPPPGIMPGSSPAVTSWGEGRLDLFVRGRDNALWHRWYAGGWSHWQSLGGVITADPAAVSWGNGRIDLFVKGSDNQMHHKYYAGGWSNWLGLGGQFKGAPSAISRETARLDVVAMGVDNRPYHMFYDRGWSGWRYVRTDSDADMSSGNYALLQRSAMNLSIYARRAANNQLIEVKSYSNSWNSSIYLPRTSSYLRSAPAVARWDQNRSDMVFRGMNNQIYHRWANAYGELSAEYNLGGQTYSSPAIESWAPGRLDIFVVGTDNRLYHKFYGGGRFSDWMPF
jgi:hypothetical protein